MKTLHNINTIYVFCPSCVPTGGVELLHQLVDYLRNHQKDAYIYYYNSPSATVPDVYSKYNIATTLKVKDELQNVIVLPETSFHISNNYEQVQTVLWWLSIDNYYHKEKRHIPLSEIFAFSTTYGLKQCWHRFIKVFRFQWAFKYDFSINKIIQKEYINAYQSEYARLHLQERGVSNLYPLKDYINTDFVSETTLSNRNPIILYNPKKGFKFTRKLIKAAPDLNFKPLQNLSRSELQTLFQTSMIYIDFGNHPGMDRLPREAALNGCCIITGTRGAAANNIDIPINPYKYKLDESKETIETVINRIREVLTTYNLCINDFETYRQRIVEEQNEFYKQIDNLFHLN